MSRITFIYSEERGLIGYISMAYGVHHYWLNSKYGFGHESLFKHVPNEAWLNETQEPSFKK